MVKKQKVPLLKISNSSSIYFDFGKKAPYIQDFDGSHTEKAGKSYSYLNTFLLSFGILAFSSIFGIIWDFYVTLPVMISIAIFSVLGFIVGKFFIKIMITNSMSSSSYGNIKQKEINKVLKQRQTFIILNLTLWIFSISVMVGILISLSIGNIHGKSSFMLSLGWFVIIALKSFHPQKALKAIKILKKQLKEGKFDD